MRFGFVSAAVRYAQSQLARQLAELDDGFPKQFISIEDLFIHRSRG
jgi:hypothetical protein